MSEPANDLIYAIFDTAANRKIIADLEKTGAKVWLFPPVETEKTVLDETAAGNFTDLKKFDWLIFADVLTVDYFLGTLEENAVDLFDLDDLRICALGETVSDRLRFASVHADVIPSKIETAEVYSALLNYIGESEIGGLRFLFLTSDSEKNNLTENLRMNHAEIVELPVYKTISTETSELIKLKTLLQGGAIDNFILTAPTDLIALKNYFKSANLAEVFFETAISVTDGVMFQVAKENNLSRVGLFHLEKVVKVN